MVAMIESSVQNAERRIVPLRERRPAADVSQIPGSTGTASSWRGVSGRRYGFTRYSLIGCPRIPRAIYILVRRSETGDATPLSIGMAEHDAPSLNLARVRQHGAQLGASEVHVYPAAASSEMRALVALDLRAAAFGTLSADVGSRSHDTPYRM